MDKDQATVGQFHQFAVTFPIKKERMPFIVHHRARRTPGQTAIIRMTEHDMTKNAPVAVGWSGAPVFGDLMMPGSWKT
jgi:hypothetical protein